MFGLFHQRRTGEGQFLSTSMIGGNVYSYSDDAVTYDGKPPVPHVRPRAVRPQRAVPPLPDRRRLDLPRRDRTTRNAPRSSSDAARLAAPRRRRRPRTAVLTEAFADRKARRGRARAHRRGRRLRHGRSPTAIPRSSPPTTGHARDRAGRRHRAPALRHHPPSRPPRACSPRRPGGSRPAASEASTPTRSSPSSGYHREQIAELEATEVVFGPD